MMRKMFLLSLALLTTAIFHACADPISSYQELSTALRNGKQMTIVLDIEPLPGQTGPFLEYFVPASMTLNPATETDLENITTSRWELSSESNDLISVHLYYTFFPNETVTIRLTSYKNQKQVGQAHTVTAAFHKEISDKTPTVAKKDYASPPLWMLRPH